MARRTVAAHYNHINYNDLTTTERQHTLLTHFFRDGSSSINNPLLKLFVV